MPQSGPTVSLLIHPYLQETTTGCTVTPIWTESTRVILTVNKGRSHGNRLKKQGAT